MGTHTKITKSIFDCAKMLIKGGATTEEIIDYLKISKMTAYRIRKSETFEDYKSAVKAAYYGANKQKLKEAEKPVVKETGEQEKQQDGVRQIERPQRTSDYYLQNRLLEETKLINESLKLISNKLAFIVEELS